MGQLPDLQQARLRLGLALSALAHDRWVVGFLRGGTLRPIAASEISRRFLEGQPLRPLSRRALYEQKPVVVNTVIDSAEASIEYDWELDWPTVMYSPIGRLDQRPIGLLIVGCRRDHWYSDEDVAYAQALGRSLAPMVSALRGPLGRLNQEETAVAHLLGHGFSSEEIARAIGTDDRRARTLVDRVTRKLQAVSSQDLAFPAMQLKRMTW
ncbi:MAG TPA: GAF domain-containing protein [Candidatus Dormibacteraeota bacterium]|nr:GAF domain-containing protein [Candidatus Dormibacteraeota bacterium]